ncbi:MAG: NADH-ubiquinone oxidoreductase-F iron-sulfur binding region domain-containing protein [Acidimicrobiales bacterium]
MADLHLTDDAPSDAERQAIDDVIDAEHLDGSGSAITIETERIVRAGTQRAAGLRHLLLPSLHALQRASGWISPGGLNHIAERLQVPPAEAYGVATFYDLFRFEAPTHDGPTMHVCVDAACQIAGAAEQIEYLEAEGVHVHPSPCLGQCERAVGVFVQRRAGDADPEPADTNEPVIPQQYDPALRLLRRVDRYDPASLEGYVGVGGFKALGAAMRLGASGVIDAVTASGLKGRGGAAFPTGIKWQAVAGEQADQKYLVVNADESEVGTFKDRYLLEFDPFALVEAATIAGFAVGATKGYVYIRGEYPLGATRLQRAIDASREAGFLGSGIARSSLDFDLEIRQGAGAYICGEETALLESIEGYRGEPRQKPPFPTTHGLFAKPTVINNVETLVNVVDIVTEGADAYAARGTPDSAGTKLYCVSGHVARPGVYEIEFGRTMREVLDLAGPFVGEPAAVLLGGGAGTFVLPDEFDLPLSFEATRAAGHSLGSGVIMVFNSTTDFGAVLTRLAAFFRDESCGQCVPCRIGTVRQHELLVRSQGAPSADDIVLIDEMDRAMKDASICGLGHTAATAVQSAITKGLIGVRG